MAETIFTQTAKVYEACYPTQKEAARALGIDRRSLWRYKKGKRIPRPDIMTDIQAGIKKAEDANRYGYSVFEVKFKNGFIYRRTTRAKMIGDLPKESLDTIPDIDGVITESGTIDNPVIEAKQKVIIRQG